MNREERRREEKLHGKHAGHAADEWFCVTQLHHQAGRLDEGSAAIASCWTGARQT